MVEKIMDKVKSPNYGLLRFLKTKGAKILGSEDPKLLKKIVDTLILKPKLLADNHGE